ncbi:MAG TPA: S8 family serine peptidase [Candidatus Cybelea sp.]|nr:S8 family serine peptidase [Candidatus Cybelea sp.]
MNRSLTFITLVAALAIAGCSTTGSSNVPASGTPSQGGQPAGHFVPDWQSKHEAKRACKMLQGGVRCDVLVVTKGIKPDCSPSGGTCGFRPIDMQTRYNLMSSLGKGSGTIVALIELGDLPGASTDLATYRNTFGLGTANFVKYNESGKQSDYPESCENFGWCIETDLDIEMVSVSCPLCTIYLIEGGNCGGVVCGLENAETTAVKLGAKILSNSWGCTDLNYGQNCGDPNFPSYFKDKSVAYLASSGDDGYGLIAWPASLAPVLAIGGTQLAQSGSTYSESVWNGAGAGCATTTPKPKWQHDPDCTGKTFADISAEAGCSPGVAEYIGSYGGWTGVCGTSVASPLVAGMLGLAGHPGKLTGGKTFWDMSGGKRKKDLHQITSGSDGNCGDYLCEAGLSKKDGGYKKYSGPAGWGTPNGIGAL